MVVDCEGGAAAGWDREGIACCGMDGDEALQSIRRSETLHHPLSFSKGQMAIFSAVVEADLPLAVPSFITRVCRLDLGILVARLAQARRARSPQIAQTSGALAAVSGWPGTSC